MSKAVKYDREEQEILEDIEQDNFKSVPDLDKEIARHRQIFKDHVTKRKQVSLRFLESDLHKVKTRAIQEGIPYQTLISSVLHKYLN
jgi:predicted DNA binding CopG/RHH family protein